MRNRQAQFIPAASEPMGLIKPIDPRYGYMAQPKKAESVLVKPIKGEVGLYQQTLDMQNMISDIELGYQQLYDNMNNFISSLPGGFQTFTTSNDPEIKKARDSFNVQRMVLNQQSDIIEAAKGTIQSNFTAWKEDNALAQHRTAITEQGVNVRYKILDKNTGQYVEKTTTANPFQLLNAGSGLNGDDKIIFEADDITNIGDYRKSQNENLNAFQDGKAANYNRVLKIDYDKERANILNSVKDVGNITVTRSSAKTKKSGNTTSAITVSNEQGSNMFPLYQAILGYTNTESTEDANTKYYLFDEFIEYMKQNGSIPLMTLENFTKEQEEQIKKTGSFTDSNGRVNKFEFNVIPKIENGKQVTTDKINKESYLSFVTNYIVNKANPQINIVDEMGEKTTAIANNTQSSQPLPKDKMNEFDLARIETYTDYTQQMATTYSSSNATSAINAHQKLVTDFGGNVEKFKPLYSAYIKKVNDFVDYVNSVPITPDMTQDQIKTRWSVINKKYQENIDAASAIIDMTLAQSNYANKSVNDPVRIGIENAVNKFWMDVFSPSNNGAFESGFFEHSARWHEYQTDSFVYNQKQSSPKKGDIFFANGQPINKTGAANTGVTVIQLNRYSPNFINYESTAKINNSQKKIYEADNRLMYNFFNQNLIRGENMTRETWESSVAISKDDFNKTSWFITDSHGKKIQKLGKDLNDEDKIQIGFIPEDNLIYSKIENEEFRKTHYIMNAYSYKLNNYAKSGGTAVPVESRR